MRILIFSTAYWPHVGGAEIAVKEITDRLRDIDFSMVTIRLDRQDKKEEQVGNIKVYRVGWGLGKLTSPVGKLDKLLFPFRAVRLANKLHRQNGYDIIWSIMASYSGFAALFFKKKNPEIKFLLTLQEGDDLAQVKKKVRLVKKWFKQIFQQADYIQAISNYLAKWAKKMEAKCPVEVVPNGIQVTSNKLQVTNIKKELNVNEGDKIVLTTSRLVEKNGIEDLINAVSQLSITNYKLLIVGDGDLSKDLKQLTKDLKIEDKVLFMGFVQPNELSKYYVAADVFCRPSITEGLGNSFLEAMAYEVPVIATPVGGIPDFLEDGKTGWFCRVKDPASITEKIKYIFDEKNKSEVEKVKDNAKQMVLDEYNWDIIFNQMKNIFQKLT